jgi:hypothetical protein
MADARTLFVVVCCVTLVLLGAAQTAEARDTRPATASPGWVDERSVSSALQRRGVVHAGRRRGIELASCLGLRGYGVRVVAFYEQFRRFRCTLWARDGRRYTAWVRITRSNASIFWWITYRTRAADS